MVPGARLLFWTALLVAPFATLAGMVPELAVASIGIIAAFGVVVLGDAVASTNRLQGLEIKLPELLRVSKHRSCRLPVQIRNPGQKDMPLRLGLALPPALTSADEEISATLPAGSEWSEVEWNCRPAARGSFLINQAFVETPSALGFWLVRRACGARCEVRVYPKLQEDRKQLAALFLHRTPLGLHAQRQVGKGREFEKLREYVPGDSYDEIHWKATARRGRPITKVYQLERTQEIYVLIDQSRLSGRMTTIKAAGVDGETGPAETILERYITAALVLGLAAEQQADLFGVVRFADRVETFVRASNGKGHYHACRDALYTAQPRMVVPHFDDVAVSLRTHLRRRGLLIFLTALDDPVLAESFLRNVDLLARQHVVLVNMIKPPGANPLFSEPGVTEMDQLYSRLGGHLQWHQLRELGTKLQRRGVKLSLLDEERLSAQLVAQYLEVKRRQLL